MIGLNASAVPCNFGIDFRTPAQRMSQILQDEEGSAFAKQEAVPGYDERTHGDIRTAVARCHDLNQAERAPQWSEQRRFGPTGKHYVNLVASHHVHGVADDVTSRGAARAVSDGMTADTELERDLTATAVAVGIDHRKIAHRTI